LNDIGPSLSLSFGSTKDNQLALASSGTVFPFGSLKSAFEDTAERLTTALPAGDQALVVTRHSVLSWPSTVRDQPNDRSVAILETPYLSTNSMEQILRRES
jgi:hypothetical protein